MNTLKGFFILLTTTLSLCFPQIFSVAHATSYCFTTGNPTTTNLVGYYNLENTSDYLGTHNLTNHGSVAFTTAKVGNGADTSGSNYLDVNAYTFSKTDHFTISGWFMYTGSGTQEVWGNQDTSSGANGYAFYVWANGLQFNLSDSASHATFKGLSGNTDYSNGTWHFAVMRWDGTTLTALIDNQNITTLSGYSHGESMTGDITGGGNFTIGNDTSHNYYWYGMIDEIGIFNTNISDSDASYLYNSGSGETLTDTGCEGGGESTSTSTSTPPTSYGTSTDAIILGQIMENMNYGILIGIAIAVVSVGFGFF